MKQNKDNLHLLWLTQSKLIVLMYFFLLFWLEPVFIDAHLIPDGLDPNDAKLYFFLRERLTDSSGNTKNIHTMVARVCPVSVSESTWLCFIRECILSHFKSSV